MKLNIIGIVGAIIAFVSIALPWWTVSVSAEFTSGTGNWYLYNAGAYGTGLSLWYDWVALLFVILGGIIALAGSIMENVKKLLIGGGILSLLSIIIFAVGLQLDLSSHTSSELGISLNVFSSGSFSYGFSYSTYLSFGFWLALVAAIIMFVAMLYPKPIPQAPSPSPSPAPSAPTPTSGT